MPDLTANVAIYSAQILVVIGVAAITGAVVRLPAHAELLYWRGVVALCLALPLVPAIPFVATGLDVVSIVSTTAPARVAAHTGRLVSAATLVPWLVLAGALARMAWLAIGLVVIGRLRSESAPATLGADVAVLRDTLAPTAALRWHPIVTQPITFGIRRPVVLLPRRLLDLSPAAQRAVVCHELLHVARRDWAWLLAEEAVRALFWFHPALWWAIGQIQLRREERVDELVVQLTDARREYMSALVTLAETPPPWRTALAFIHRGQLAARLARLGKRVPISIARLSATCVALVAITGITSLGTVSAMPLRRDATAAGGQRIYSAAEGVLLPKVIKEIRPNYTQRAMQRKIAGTVLLDCVVTRTGAPSRVKVLRPLDADLDRAAVRALEQWRFSPGTKGGKPVAVRVKVEMTFTLK
jgi:bla regulator protein blaR1